MGTVGFSAGMMEDHRIRQVVAESPDLLGLWITVVLWSARNGNALTLASLEEIRLQDLRGGLDAEKLAEMVESLVDAELLDGDGRVGWRVIENGLWTLAPDEAVDFYGGDLEPDS